MTASPEAVAATSALLAGGQKIKRSQIAEAFDAFAAPAVARAEAAEAKTKVYLARAQAAQQAPRAISSLGFKHGPLPAPKPYQRVATK